jgi:hypothetical protein
MYARVIGIMYAASRAAVHGFRAANLSETLLKNDQKTKK